MEGSDEDNDEDKQIHIGPIAPPMGRSLGPSHHHNQPVPGNFSLLKRQDGEKSERISDDKNESSGMRGPGKGAQFSKGRAKGSDEGMKSEGREGGGAKGGGAKGEVGGAKGGGGGAKGGIGGVKGKGGGAKSEGGGKAGEQRSHQSKERHKGSRANHNRRALADRKRDRGMAGPPARY